MRFFTLASLSIASLCSLATARPVHELIHTDDKPYSDSVTVFPDAAIGFTASFEGEGNDLSSQANNALGQLQDTLAQAGLNRTHVANVRAYLKTAKDDDMSEAMSAWNQAFTNFFAENENPPTRTTIGSAALQDPDALIAIDAIIAAPSIELENTLPTPANNRVATVTDVQLRIVSPFSSLLITSGVLADPLQSGGREFGDTQQQTVSALEKLESTLLSWGLSVEDLAFTRILLSPSTDEEGNQMLDTTGFSEGWNSFWEPKRSTPPPHSFFSGPGFSNSGRLIEIEFYAVFPDAAGPFARVPQHGEASPSPIIRTGNPESFLSSSVAIARDAKKIWFSGAISRDRNGLHGQAAESLLTLHERMEAIGIDFSDTAQLRAYLNFSGPFGPNFSNWNTAYRRFFDHDKINPEKPVRTAFPIENLPDPLLIEIEILAATR